MLVLAIVFLGIWVCSSWLYWVVLLMLSMTAMLINADIDIDIDIVIYRNINVIINIQIQKGNTSQSSNITSDRS